MPAPTAETAPAPARIPPALGFLPSGRKTAGALLAALLFLPFPPQCPASSPFPSGSSYSLAFSPQGQGANLIIQTIQAAQNSVMVAVYNFTSRPIARALLAAHKRGIQVRVIVDKENSGRYSAATFLANQGVPVRTSGRYAAFHHKFMVIDGRHVQTGSFNYTSAAQNKNAENVLILRDVPDLAGGYAREWEKLWREGEEMRTRY